MPVASCHNGRMCGRYADAREEEIVEAFTVTRVVAHQPPSRNVAPTQQVRIVVEDAAEPGVDAAPQRVLRAARWGLVPSWAKAIGARPQFNARSETLTVKPSFQAAAAHRRAIFPALGYYEWTPDAQGVKRPYFLRSGDGGVIGFAGIYEWWRVPAGLEVPGAEDGWLCSSTIVTRPATDYFPDGKVLRKA